VREEITGAGINLLQVLVAIAGENILILLLAAIPGTMLGTAIYIMMTSLTTPTLIQRIRES
jgi:TRAP-type uncharacterized transport system fused permease subunit